MAETDRESPVTHSDNQSLRVCMPSIRKAGGGAAWGAGYEFQDIISEVDHVHRIDLDPGRTLGLRQKAVRRLVWRQISKRATRLNPGFKPVSLDRDYDLFAFVCMNPWELLYLNAIQGWKERCRKKVCFIFEVWAGVASRYRHLIQMLDDFDQVFIGFQSAVPATQEMTKAPCHFVPPASDTLRFSPYPNPPERSIDVFSLGRRLEGMHKEFLEMAERRELFYIYDTLPGKLVQPTNYREHRALFANMAKRSKFFVTYPAKVDFFQETQGLSEPGTRFYEGVATGAVMIGQAPDSNAFRRDFNWPDSVITVGDRDAFMRVMADMKRDPGRLESVAKRNVVEALGRHDWMHRWKEILDVSGEPTSDKFEVRDFQLKELAKTII